MLQECIFKCVWTIVFSLLGINHSGNHYLFRYVQKMIIIFDKVCENQLYFIFLLQGATVNGLINLGLSTLERRFNLKSVQTGFIAGSYDIGFMAATLPISYFGGMKGASKPRYLWEKSLISLSRILQILH